MRNNLIPIYVVLILAFTCLHVNADQSYFVHKNGYGPVSIGMSVKEASKAFGQELKPAHTLDEDDKLCHYVYPDGNYKKIGFMVERGLVTRVDVHSNLYTTDSGVTVGQSDRMVYEKYKDKVSEQIHPYIGTEGKYLIVNTQKGFQLIFETDNGVITSFRTGKLPSVAYIEGCL